VWILDAIEHHDERRYRRAADDLLNAVIGGLLDVGDDALMDPAA